MSITWEISLATLVVIVVQVIGVVIFMVRSQAEAAAAKRDADAAMKAANDAVKAADAVKDSLAAYKVDVAQTYASRETMAEALRPLLDEMHALRDRIDKLIDRAAPAAPRRQ